MIKIIQVTKEVTTLSYFFCLLNIYTAKTCQVSKISDSNLLVLLALLKINFLCEFYYWVPSIFNERSESQTTGNKPVKNVKNMWILTYWNTWCDLLKKPNKLLLSIATYLKIKQSIGTCTRDSGVIIVTSKEWVTKL